MHSRDQTIFALSSGRPPSAIAMVRVSGTQAGAALRALAGRIPSPRRATRVVLRDGQGEPIDDAVVLWFPGPASATGEDVAEFHVHGGRGVLAALVAALSSLEHMRAAEPGEFTRRAFENGKLDLTEAEGLDDLIHADTDRQRRRALRQLKGMLGDKARDWRARIIEASALIEAGIDFSDEGDVSNELIAPARGQIAALLGEIQEVLAAQGKAERLRDGLVVAITGPPNVGKSTLINQLARREVAIVSPHAGTTRDVIEVQLDLDGYPVTVIDTAGIRETDDPVEQEGVRRARTRAEEADLVLWLADTPAANHSYDASSRAGFAQQDRSRFAKRRCAISGNRCTACGGIDCGESRRREQPVRNFRHPWRRHSGADLGFGEFCAGFFWARRGWLDHQGPTAGFAGANGSFVAALHCDVRSRRGICCGGFAGRGLCFGTLARQGRCRGYFGCDFPRILHRKVMN